MCFHGYVKRLVTRIGTNIIQVENIVVAEENLGFVQGPIIGP